MASRNISISLPEEMIQQATQLATREQRTLSELFREAFRVYRAQQLKKLLDEANQHGSKEQEVMRIAKEIRAELEAEHTVPQAEPEEQ
jgi:metal-responsive CopG/Arc/MetJ family transcriptional regulator